MSILDEMSDEDVAALVRTLPDAALAKMARGHSAAAYAPPRPTTNRVAPAMAGNLRERLEYAFSVSARGSMRALCMAANLSPGVVATFATRHAKWEQDGREGQEPTIKAAQLTKLARVAGVRAGWLITGEGSAK